MILPASTVDFSVYIEFMATPKIATAYFYSWYFDFPGVIYYTAASCDSYHSWHLIINTVPRRVWKKASGLLMCLLSHFLTHGQASLYMYCGIPSGFELNVECVPFYSHTVKGTATQPNSFCPRM